MSIQEIAKSLSKAGGFIEKRSTEDLKEDLKKMAKWQKETSDRLEKLVWHDLSLTVKRELRRRNQK